MMFMFALAPASIAVLQQPACEQQAFDCIRPKSSHVFYILHHWCSPQIGG